jgi:hypothetical protein
MPENKLEKLLIERMVMPPPVELPEGDSNDWSHKITDFGNALIGEQKAGSLPAALGATIGMFGPGKLKGLSLRGISSLGVADAKQLGILPKVAPKRAAQELADVLLGRSARVPAPSIYKEIPEADASLQAMLMTRTGGVPPARTSLGISPNDPLFKSVVRDIPQAKGIREAYKARRALQGKGDQAVRTTVNSGSLTADKRQIGPVPTPQSASLAKVRPITSQTGSLHAAGMKPLTKKEIKGLMEGPVEAFKRGLISEAEMAKRLEINRAKITAQEQQLVDKTAQTFNQKMEKALLNRRGR